MNGENEGRREAHTARKSGEIAGIGGADLDPRPLADQLKAALEAEAGVQPGLFDDDEPPLPETMAVGATRSRLVAKRERGRPLGAGNKRSELMRDTLLKVGFEHPMVVLAGIASATVDELATEIAGGDELYKRLTDKLRIAVRTAAVAQIKDAADKLNPYFESKRPTEVHVDQRQRAVFLVGHLDQAQAETAVLSLGGGMGNPFQFQGVSGTGDVRVDGASSHDDD